MIVLGLGALALEQMIEHNYRSSPLTSLRTDAKDEISNRVLTNPSAYVDQEVAVRGNLQFVDSEKPSHFFSTPYGLNYHSKSEDGTLLRTNYRLLDSDHQDRIGVRIDEYQEGGLFSSAKYTDFSGKQDLVGKIKFENGAYILVVDHVPPVKIP